MSETDSFGELVAHLRRIETVDGISNTLDWDQQTMMPPKAAALRGEQQALLAGLSHAYISDPRIGDWLTALEGSEDPVRAATSRNLGRTYRREKRVPADLVDALARAKSEGFGAWVQAKKSSDWASFEPKLQHLVDLTRRRAEAIDAERHPYEVLLEEFDPGSTVATLRDTFGRLRDGLVPLLEAIAGAPQLPGIDRELSVEGQESLHREIAEALGYDFGAGRLDHAEHPFTSGLGPGDVRITTHLSADDFFGGLGSTVHETGHALYEQGLPHAHRGTTVAEAASFGLHESQSRFWENFVGRSEAFFRWLAPKLPAHFEGATPDADALYRAANRVMPSLIRVEADEVTYNLHVIVRFELELALFEGTLAVSDLPAAWNAKYEEYLGVTPPDDARGVLQDVHWSSGAFAYFPSYTLGNLYAASMGKALEETLPALWSQIEAGEFAPILGWLREKVHARGHLLEAPEIVKEAVGERDHVADLLDYLWQRHGALYGVSRPTSV